MHVTRHEYLIDTVRIEDAQSDTIKSVSAVLSPLAYHCCRTAAVTRHADTPPIPVRLSARDALRHIPGGNKYV